MKHPSKIFFFFLLICLSANSCKKDDDDNPSNDSDNFSEYFKCKINGVEFTTRSDFNCNGKTFYYYPAGAGGLDEAYMLISGRDCSNNLSAGLRIFDPIVPSMGTFEMANPQFADSISPAILHIANGEEYFFDSLLTGTITISHFSPRDSITMDFGRIEGTFEYTVSDKTRDSVAFITDGSFRFKVANFW